jgi:hypothetical protein
MFFGFPSTVNANQDVLDLAVELDWSKVPPEISREPTAIGPCPALRDAKLAELSGTPRRCRALRSLGVMLMRAKKPSAVLVSTKLLEVVSHTAMGVALGLAFAFALTHIAQLGVMAFIDHSLSPRDAMTMVVGTCVTTFAIGTTMTGFALSRLGEVE